PASRRATRARSRGVRAASSPTRAGAARCLHLPARRCARRCAATATASRRLLRSPRRATTTTSTTAASARTAAAAPAPTAPAPTPAQGTMASFKNTAYVDGQVFTLSDGAHSVTFEFDNNSVIGAGNVPIDIKNSALQDDMMCRICAAINGSGLNIATGGLGCPAGGCAGNTITLTNNIKGAVGNVKITTTVTSTTFRNGLAGMHLGSGQDCGTAIGCTSNEDCASDVCSLSMTCPGGVPCGACVAASCSDTKQNGLETDLDCGGGTCSGCAATKHCVANT